MKTKLSKKRRGLKLPKITKKHAPYLLGLGLFFYLVLAYNYFYFVQRRAHIPWPDNQHIYNFNGADNSENLYVSIGDSLTYGFGADKYEDGYTYQLARHLAKDQAMTLKDYSYPGFRTDDVIKQLDLIIADKPKIITVFIGVNDAHQLLETSDFKENYDYILYKLSTETEAKLYVINLPYLGASNIQLPPYNYYYSQKIRGHNKVIKNLAKKYNISYIDLYSETGSKFKDSGQYYSKDSFHPSSAGYGIWARIIENAVD